MKILIIIEHLYSGGTQTQSLFMAKQFPLLGHPTHLLTFRAGGPFEFKAHDLNYTTLQSEKFGFDFLAPGLFKNIKKINPDVIICMGFEANYYAGFIQKKCPHIHVVGTVRTGKNLPFLYLWSLKKTQSIHVNSHWWKTFLTQKGFDENKISVIHNPIVLDYESVDEKQLRTQLRSQLNIPEETCIFLCVQGFRPGKNQDKLIKTFQRVSPEFDWQLWLVGDGPYLKKCQELTSKLALDSKIKFFGFQNNPIPYYATADVVVSASERDSLPNLLIEGQAFGCPVIAINTVGVPEAFQIGKTGFIIKKTDNEGFLQSINYLLKFPENRKLMGKHAREFARTHFSPLNQAKKTLDAISLL